MAKITVVEDQENLCALVAKVLTDRGHEVMTFGSATSALAHLEGAEPPDLLIADARLPDGTCDALVDQLQEAHAPEFPILVLSGLSNEVEFLHGFVEGSSKRYARFGRYRLLEVIGRGATGTVYRARDFGYQHRPVALKVLAPVPESDREIHLRFLREIYSLSAVRHPNVVPVVDFGIHEGRPYYAMEEIPGVTLRAKVEEEGPASPREVLTLLAGLARALSSLHASEIVHRDVTPSNVILRDGRWDQPVLIDFGLAKHSYDRGLTHENLLMGTPGYVAPEALLGRPLDARSDLFSLGLVGRFAALGQEVFPELDGLPLIHHMSQHAVSMPAGLPAGLHALLTRLTRLEPEDRYASADATELAVRRLLTTDPELGAIPKRRRRGA